MAQETAGTREDSRLATKSKGGVLLPVVILVAAALYFGGTKVVDWGQRVIDVLTGGNSDFAVASAAKALVKHCSTEQVLNDRKCGDMKIVVLNAAKMPLIGRNIQLAWSEGKPYILHKDAPGSDQVKRNVVCGAQVFKAQYPKGSCDEYPFASSVEGGEGARTEEVPLREQNCQGGSLRGAYRKAGVTEGDAFLVVLSNPDSIADSTFTGVDIAKDQSCTS